MLQHLFYFILFHCSIYLFYCSVSAKGLQENGRVYANYFHFCMRDVTEHAPPGDATWMAITVPHEYYHANEVTRRSNKHLFSQHGIPAPQSICPVCVNFLLRHVSQRVGLTVTPGCLSVCYVSMYVCRSFLDLQPTTIDRSQPNLVCRYIPVLAPV